MQVQLTYNFTSSQQANRFVNALRNWPTADVDARLHRTSQSVRVSYSYVSGGFDPTCAALDDLAAEYGGAESNSFN
ncbi:hypothetical protein [Lacimicrobium alkaliphilum]|uniref:Uncharacterized protein n=1 Tax=Lacimicrobium alkaliphilum TaxID=1526571 RepID=A0ABQ1R3A0_9ALTE|nr:hypothetical protein [Lacimicrobium alkaliphilum]GGD53405.1 hypothetical protein GCM10011357_06520 [Lacimicrobium alkaliphilum]